MNMNAGFAVCASLSGLFLLFAIFFAVLKGKGAILISGFNALSKEDRQKYDQVRMSKDMRNSFLLWALVLAIGALCAYFISSYLGFAALFVWLILFFKDVHLDTEKAFEKYRL